MDQITRKSLLDDDEFSELSIKRRCELLGIHRSSVYYVPVQRSCDAICYEEKIKRRIDYWHTQLPYSGARKLCRLLGEEGLPIGRKLMRRYMGEMGIYAIYPKPNLSKKAKGQRPMPYLLKNMNIFLPNQVWAVDITYIPMRQGHMYLTAVIDWYSRYIVGWTLSDTLETAPVIDALREAIKLHGTPGIINSDQGAQFTSEEYISYLRENGVRQSMDGKARWVDNVIIERWFRSLKVEYVYINEYNSPKDLRSGIEAYIKEYNYIRPHQSHGYDTPAVAYKKKFAA